MKITRFIKTVVIVAFIVFVINAILGNTLASIKYLHYYLVYSAVFGLGNFLYFNFVGKYLGWDKNPERTLIISILGAIPLNAGIYFLLNWFFKVVIFGQDFNVFISKINVIEYLVVVMFALIIALFIMIGFVFKSIREAKLKAEQLKTQNERIKFESLKAQLDPHFLFNNLNVLTALITENPQKAEAFSLDLSDVYKYVVAQKEIELVPLQKEIDFAGKYLNLLKMRYENAVQFTFPDTKPENAQIPPLSLQVLLENAVKHNRITDHKPLKINIYIKDDYLWCENHKLPKHQPRTSGTGLSNLINRYQLLSKKPVIIEENEKDFKVGLPLL